jgi:hypothetical protein
LQEDVLVFVILEPQSPSVTNVQTSGVFDLFLKRAECSRKISLAKACELRSDFVDLVSQLLLEKSQVSSESFDVR